MTHSLNSVLRFGKYKGLTVAAIIRFDPRYLGWAVNNLEHFDLDAEARKVGQQALNRERQFSMNQQNAWAWGFGREARGGRSKHDREMIRIEYEERKRAGHVCEVDRHTGQTRWIVPAIAMARDSAETACPAPVPQDCQARAESIAQDGAR